MEHKFLRLFVDGKWTGKEDRSITINGVKHDMDEYAKEHGITLPDAKKSTKKVNYSSVHLRRKTVNTIYR